MYRDLKPENLLLEDNEDDNKIKVIDFGLAGIAEGNTLEGYCGSMGYMAPEILSLLPHGNYIVFTYKTSIQNMFVCGDLLSYK